MTPEQTGALLAGCRWLLYAAVLGVVGAAGARFVAARLGLDPFRATLQRRLDRLAMFASLAWLLALASTFAAQVVSWFGPRAFADYSLMHDILSRTRWGEAWIISFASAIGALAATGVTAWRGYRPVGLLAPVGAILTTPMLGHAAGGGKLLWFLHTTHLLGTGLWLGTLLMLALSTWAFWRDDSRSPTLLRTMLESFTPVALSGAALAIATGLFISAEHVWPVGRFVRSGYGVTLMVKVAIVAIIGILGWINWRRLRPAADLPHKRRQLRRAVIAELAIGFGLVLAATAWLTGLEMPM